SYYSYVLDELTDEAKLWQRMAKSQRRRISRGEESYVVRDDMGMDVLLPLVKETFGRRGLTFDDDPIMAERVLNAAADRESGRILIAVDKRGKAVAGAFFVWDAASTFYLLGGRTDDVEDDNAMPLVLWEGIRRAAGVSQQFDFEGSMIEGVEAFFRRFGGHPVPYSHLERLSPLADAARHGRQYLGSARQLFARASN
ncbi:MAG: GNAT family N-acetyltransferase, partial [Acidimicrobiales bacterium]